MKVIIEIPERVFEARKLGEISPWVTVPILDAVQNGTSLDEIKAKINELSGFYDRVTGIREMDTVRSIISDVNNIIDKHVANMRGDEAE